MLAKISYAFNRETVFTTSLIVKDDDNVSGATLQALALINKTHEEEGGVNNLIGFSIRLDRRVM